MVGLSNGSQLTNIPSANAAGISQRQ